MIPIGGVANTFLAGFDASWEVDLFGKTRRSVEAADAALDASAWNRRRVLVSLLGELGTDYTALRATQERITIARHTIDADQDASALARQKFDHGLAVELDVAQAEAELEQVQAALPQLETQSAQLAHAIAVLLGKTARGASGPPGRLLGHSAAAADPAGHHPLRGGAQSPGHSPAERTLAAANAEIGVAVAAKFPSFSLSPSLGVESGTLNKLLTASGLTWGVAGSLGQPIYEGGALDAAVDKAKAVTEENRLAFERTVLKAFAEVEDTLVGLGNEGRRHTRLQSAVDANRLALQRATELYRGGLTPFINVVTSERNLYGAEDGLVQSTQALTQQTVALYKALGGGWQVAGNTDLAEGDGARPN